MAELDVAAAITHAKRILRLPDVSEYPADADFYAYFRDAENRVKHDIGMAVPNLLWGAPTLMTSTDSGYTYGFGTDAGSNAILPLGHVAVYPDKASIPFYPLESGIDFVFEGTKIRFTQYSPQTFSDGPYAQFITPTYVIDGSSNAFTLPFQLRMLAIYDACVKVASSGAVQDDARYERMYQDELARHVTNGQISRGAGQISRMPRGAVRTFHRGGR